MTDKQLLIDAAKAAGIDIPWTEDAFGGGIKIYDGGGYSHYWNPLTDDGDAFRLSVKLKISVNHEVWINNDYVGANNLEYSSGADEKYEDDPYAATRRAIVRVAAEIGKTL